VNVNVGAADEYADLSKDATGAYRKGKDSHKGQLLYDDGKGNYGVVPIYAHASRALIEEQLSSVAGTRVLASVRSGCLIELLEPIAKEDHRLIVVDDNRKARRTSPTADLPASTYTWRTIKTESRQVFLENSKGQRITLGLKALAIAGFRAA
jgi:hypothetical protein